MQRKAIRLIAKSNKRANTTPIWKNLQILSFNELLKFNSIQLNYSQTFTNAWTHNNQETTLFICVKMMIFIYHLSTKNFLEDQPFTRSQIHGIP
jgi:hypothetical protein